MNIMYKILSDYQDECHVQQSHVDKSTMTSFVHMYVCIKGGTLCSLDIKSLPSSCNILHMNIMYKI